MNKTVLDVQIAGTTDPVKTAWLPLAGAEPVGVHLVATGTLKGAWRIFATCSPTAAAGVNEDAIGIENLLTAALQPVVAASNAPDIQFAQCPRLNAGFLQVVFTPTTGTGEVRVHRWVGE